jgi:hypothetical protein
MSRSFTLALTLAAILALTSAAQATVYVFTAQCPDGKNVVEQWTTDETDPGKESIRDKTQQKHPDCKIADYKAATDTKYLKNTQFFSTKPDTSGSWMPNVGNPFGGVGKSLCGMINC